MDNPPVFVESWQSQRSRTRKNAGFAANEILPRASSPLPQYSMKKILTYLLSINKNCSSLLGQEL
ncbi:MAG TPA: hypothetical protein DCE56_08805 [Cyanobacteria bacterium UBA8553]|nr:hypothetical protein [Cyanobacteria bacterium UBA8553]HAJ61788.1 hypothetical protein [Cyanobacteria bacterium UBA8543]